MSFPTLLNPQLPNVFSLSLPPSLSLPVPLTPSPPLPLSSSLSFSPSISPSLPLYLSHTHMHTHTHICAAMYRLLLMLLQCYWLGLPILQTRVRWAYHETSHSTTVMKVKFCLKSCSFFFWISEYVAITLELSKAPRDSHLPVKAEYLQKENTQNGESNYQFMAFRNQVKEQNISFKPRLLSLKDFSQFSPYLLNPFLPLSLSPPTLKIIKDSALATLMHKNPVVT